MRNGICFRRRCLLLWIRGGTGLFDLYTCPSNQACQVSSVPLTYVSKNWIERAIAVLKLADILWLSPS